MKVKRYVVDDLPEAVQLIRSELGSDAVILNTKEIRIGGFLGMFRKKRVEVIAAVDEAAKPKPRPAAAVSRASAAPRPGPAPAPSPAAPAAGVALMTAPAPEAEDADMPVSWLPPTAVRERYSRGTGGGDALAPSPKAAEAAKEILAALAAKNVDTGETSSKGSGGASAVPVEPPYPTRPIAPDTDPGTDAGTGRRNGANGVIPASASDESSALLEELRAMKEMMIKLNRPSNARTFPAEVMELAKRLAAQGVEPAYVERFAEDTAARVAGGDSDRVTEPLEAARQVLREWLLPAVGSGISASTKVVHFVGPTGVGKTTTIAKLAADQAFVHRRSVGFITADTYRIAAVDQLRTYADILNMPLEVVFSPSELNRAYKKLEDRDLLLMDTAGRNYRNELFVSEVNSLLSPGQQSESVLVLSLTHKYSDMKQVAGHFSRYGVKRLLLTKMDETNSYGAIVNLVKEFDFEISYVTCGQTVPDDIQTFDPEDIIGRLLGDSDHE